MTRAERNIAWIEKHLVVPQDKDVGRPVRLREWQKEEIRRIYDNPAGTRRAILSFGRKNGKTALAAFLMLLHLCGPEARPNSQLFSAAQSRDQAAVLFGLAAKIVRLSPTLGAGDIIVRDTAKQLEYPELGTLYRALSAEAKTAYGLSPSFIVHDELGQVKGPRSELYEALETATGAQEKPLSIIISTQAPTDADLLSLLIDDAATGADPKTVLSLHTADLSADPFVEETIRQANPAFGDFQSSEETLAMAAAARRMPSRENEYRNLILNQRVDINQPFITRTVWETCSMEPGPLDGLPVYAGLDLSEVRDLTAFVALGVEDQAMHVHPTFWLPSEGLVEKSRQDRVPYDLWHDDEQLMTVPGRTIDYEYVADFIVGFCSVYDVRKIAFDRWNFRHLRPWIVKAGMREERVDDLFEQFGQGFASMSPALRQLESAILNRRLRHGAHPVLSMCAANATVQQDPAGNRKLSKARSHGRIDGMVALAMAVSVAETGEETVKSNPLTSEKILARGGFL